MKKFWNRVRDGKLRTEVLVHGKSMVRMTRNRRRIIGVELWIPLPGQQCGTTPTYQYYLFKN